MQQLLTLILTLLFASSYAQELSPKDLEQIRNSVEMDAYTKAMQNALSKNNINDIAKNLSNSNENDHHFTYKVKVRGITNQKSSGRCWLFTSLNMFRPRAMQVFNVHSFEYSQNYLYFWDLFEKANLFLNNIIETADSPIDDRLVQWYFKKPVADGGTWINFANLMDKYGLIPKEAMTETQSSENTRYMLPHINLKLKENALRLRQASADGAKPKELQQQRTQMMSEIYRMLVLNLGTPPTQFEWRYKDKTDSLTAYTTYTPHEFKTKVLGDIQASDYVMLMNDPTRPFDTHYEIDNYRNIEEGANWHYVNLTNDKIKAMAIQSLKNNEAMYASCDVAQQLDRTNGFLDLNNYDYESVYGVTFGMNKAERIQTRTSGSTHGMALIAVELNDDRESTKWQFENSWGTASGYKGYLTATDQWFDEYMFRIVIHKAFISPEIMEIYDTTPTLLPPWDWMQ